MKPIITIIFSAILSLYFHVSMAQVKGEPWKIHIIDKEGFGADGARLYQYKKTNLFTVSWEQSGYSRVYVYNRKFKQKYIFELPSKGGRRCLNY